MKPSQNETEDQFTEYPLSHMLLAKIINPKNPQKDSALISTKEIN